MLDRGRGCSLFENGLHPRIRAGLETFYPLEWNGLDALLHALNAEFRWVAARHIGPPLKEAPVKVQTQYPFSK